MPKGTDFISGKHVEEEPLFARLLLIYFSHCLMILVVDEWFSVADITNYETILCVRVYVCASCIW